MIRVLVPVFIIAIICITAAVITRRDSKATKAKALEKENATLRSLVNNLDKEAYAEYTVSSSPYAASVLDAIRRHNSKENE